VNHNLIEILRCPAGVPGAFTVVRWCVDCGAVVVDTDIDGRTAPGDYMPMRLPSGRGCA
jgi:hypothetical protein